MIDQKYVDLLSVGKEEALAILGRARAIKKDPARFAGACRNKLLFALFEKTSTRTNLSFGRAMSLLGGVYLPQRWVDSNFAISDIELEARYVATTADCILVRLKHHEDVCKVARMEMAREMVDHENAVIFPQALNRTYAQASVLVSACGPG